MIKVTKDTTHTNKKHGNATKPGFHATMAFWYLLKLLVSGSWWDECIMVYFKTSSFSKLARILQFNWPQKQSPLVSWYDIPTCKVWCWLIKGNSSYRKKKLMFYLKLLVYASWQGLYSPINPKTILTCVLIWSTHLQSLMLIDQRKLKLS